MTFINDFWDNHARFDFRFQKSRHKCDVIFSQQQSINEKASFLNFSGGKERVHWEQMD